ncbi:hypothetical protein SGP15020_41530 [Shigella flexneri]|nr:hypothetical protein SGP15020_41530 [Shigella flexneri]
MRDGGVGGTTGGSIEQFGRAAGVERRRKGAVGNDGNHGRDGGSR